MKRDTRLVQAMDRLADILDYGHLLLATDAVVFIDAAGSAIQSAIARAEAAEAAVGMMVAAACPDMEMSPDDPVGMAHGVVTEMARLREQVKELKQALKNEMEWTRAFAGDAKTEADRADIAEAEVERLRAIVVAAYNTGLLISGVDLRSALGMETDSELN